MLSLGIDIGSVGDTQAQGFPVDNDLWMTAIDHRGHGKFTLTGRADSAHHQRVQRCVQRAGRLCRHEHAAARQRKNHGFDQLQRSQALPKHSHCLDTIASERIAGVVSSLDFVRTFLRD